MPRSLVRYTLLTLLAAGLITAALPPATAIQPGWWTQSSEADFAPGDVEGTVVTNLGDIKLAAATSTIEQMPDGVSIIYDIETVGGVTYLAAGPQGKLLKIEGGQAVEAAVFESEQIFTLSQDNGELLIGISGSQARVAKLVEGKPETLVELSDARFIWEILPHEGELLIATGPDGTIYRGKTPDGGEPQVDVLLDTSQANVLALAAGPDGTVYAGTDTGGLVYRITPDGKAFVAYDAGEPEIGSLLVMPDGTVYAGTADANQARPGRLEEAEDEETGRPHEDEEESLTNPEEPPKEIPMPEEESDSVTADTAVEKATPESPEQPAKEQAEHKNKQKSPNENQENQMDSSDPGGPEAEAGEPGETTQDQHDALRELIRQKLLVARRTGKIKPTTSRGPGGKPRETRPASAASTGDDEGGNAVYRIDPEGFVTTVFRESVIILRLTAETQPDGGHTILIATGPEGQLFRVDPDAGETSVVLDLDATSIPALSVDQEGHILLGTADPAELITLEPGVAKRGVYTSDILDAKHISLWGTFNITAAVPEGSSVLVETRSGNVRDPEMAAWSEWSEAQVFMPDPKVSPLQPREVTIQAPPARFLQYRLTLTSDASNSPSVGKVQLAYVMPNVRPHIDSIKASYPATKDDQPPATAMNIEWEATDANGDRLLYTLAYRPAGTAKWLNLASDLTETSHAWETNRVPDGYYLLRLTADDRLDNPGGMALSASRRSDPVLADNTPPSLEGLTHAVRGDTVAFSGTAVDRYSPIASIAYSLDDDEIYTPILPTDLIFDSTREAFAATISDLSLGPHVVTVRVRDARGNTTHAPVIFEVK